MDVDIVDMVDGVDGSAACSSGFSLPYVVRALACRM